MYIRDVTIENVKSFKGQYKFTLKPGVNFFVGDNNSGKSTVLEALLFLFEGPSSSKWTPEKFYCTKAEGQPTRVEVDIAGGVDDLVNRSKFQVLKDFIFEDHGDRILRLERSSEPRTVMQKGKEKKVDVKSVCFWHPEHGQFENVTGIDAKVKAIFDFESVWADAQPSDHIDFASTKTLGRLLDASFKRFTETDPWKNLFNAHKQAFSDENEGSFLSETTELAAQIKGLVDDQYGQADYRFSFELPDANVFMKQGSLHVNDGFGETPVDGKGTGMQRAIALGIIQVYARSTALADAENPTPLILMLDEPETWLHPTAQLKLGDALGKIGEREQVFVVTHSPYLIRKFDSNNHLLTVLSGHGADREIKPSTKFGLFGVGEPTWGEINYRAFEVPSNDFHNELYGYVQRYLGDQLEGNKAVNEKEMECFLEKEGIAKDKVWKRDTGKTYPATLPGYVRNSIHHPENQLNAPVTASELHQSIGVLVDLVERLQRSA